MATAIVRHLQNIQRNGGLKSVDIANVMNVSRPTVSRWLSGENKPSVSVQVILSHLQFVVDRLTDFYTPEEIRIWIFTQQPLLDNERPIDLVISGETEKILDLLQEIDAGAYS